MASEVRSRYLTAIALALVALVIAANATAFAYRWMQGDVSVAPANQAQGAACTGFYSKKAQPNIPLPNLGTNYDAPTYGNNVIQVQLGSVACEFDQYKLYESIKVTLPITVGSWYIKDFYGFGYYTPNGPTVYVFIKVNETITPSTAFDKAELIVIKINAQQEQVDSKVLNLRQSGAQVSFQLQHGEALRLDLFLRANQPVEQATFSVGFFVSQENESP